MRTKTRLRPAVTRVFTVSLKGNAVSGCEPSIGLERARERHVTFFFFAQELVRVEHMTSPKIGDYQTRNSGWSRPDKLLMTLLMICTPTSTTHTIITQFIPHHIRKYSQSEYRKAVLYLYIPQNYIQPDHSGQYDRSIIVAYISQQCKFNLLSLLWRCSNGRMMHTMIILVSLEINKLQKVHVLKGIRTRGYEKS